MHTELRERWGQQGASQCCSRRTAGSLALGAPGALAELRGARAAPKPEPRSSDLAVGALVGMAAGAVGGGVLPLPAVLLHALGGSLAAALLAAPIEDLFAYGIAEGEQGAHACGDEQARGGARASRAANVLCAPAHTLLLAGLVAVPIALVLAAFSPAPAALGAAAPHGSSAAKPVLVQLLAIASVGGWAAGAMALVLLATAADSQRRIQGSLLDAGSIPSDHSPSSADTPHQLSAQAASQHESRQGTPARASPGLTCGSSCSGGRTTSPGRLAPHTDTPAVSSGRDDVRELARRFCVRHRLSEDCSPHIAQHALSRRALNEIV